MPKLPTVSGQEIILALERPGFVVASQRRSHVKLRRNGKIVIVPAHKILKRKILVGILRQAEISPDEILEALAQ